MGCSGTESASTCQVESGLCVCLFGEFGSPPSSSSTTSILICQMLVEETCGGFRLPLTISPSMVDGQSVLQTAVTLKRSTARDSGGSLVQYLYSKSDADAMRTGVERSTLDP